MQTETPYTKAIQELNVLLEEGKRIAEAVAGAKKLKGQTDIGAGLAKHIGLAKFRTIDQFGGGIKKVADAATDISAISIALWYKRLLDGVAGLHTGRRGCELSGRAKKSFLKQLSDASESRSPNTLLNRSLAITASLATRLTVIECNWMPRGKLIPAGRLIKGIEEVESILIHSCRGYVKLCDPYCSRQTLSALEATPKMLPIVVLTMRIVDGNDFTDALSRVRKSGRDVSVAILSARPGFHDRYIVTQGRGWTVGTSIKDIGNRDTLIHEIDNRDEIEAMIDDYLSGSRGALQRL